MPKLHEKIICSRYYRNPENQNIVNLVKDSDIRLNNASVLSAKQRITRDAKAYKYEPISKWAYDSFTNDWKRYFEGPNGMITAMVHLFE